MNSSSTPTSAETLELIDQIKQEWTLQYSQATAKDKELLAYLLQRQPVEPEWFALLTNHSVNGKMSSVTSDARDKLVAVAKVYVTMQTVCVASIPFTLGTGYAFYHAPGFITGGLFLASFSTFVISREAAIKYADRVAKLEGVPGAIIDFVTQKRTAVELTNNIEKSIDMTVSFRNLNSSDNNIQADIREAFDGEAVLELKDGLLQKMYNNATKKMTKLKGLYPSYVPAIGKKAPTNINLSVLAKDIVIKGSSDPLIKVSSYVVGDICKIKATSTSTADVNFNLTIAYEGFDGNELTKDIPFVFKSAPSPLEGAWILESRNGVAIGQDELVYNNTNCPSIATQLYVIKSGRLFFDKVVFSDEKVGEITFFEKEIDSNCKVTRDNWDTTGSFGSSSGIYKLEGDILSLGSYSFPVNFISANKIQLIRGNVTEVYNKE